MIFFTPKLVFPSLIILWFGGCAEKRVPDDELVREYLYAIKPVELWSLAYQDSVSLTQVNEIATQNFLRKYMRISEMDEEKFMPICSQVAQIALQDAGFFLNNSKGRENFEAVTNLRKKSPDEYDKLIKRGCSNSLSMLKGRALARENRKRSNNNIATEKTKKP